ncbi:MAG: DUF3108 domain-containing protein [Acidobacteriota bacterium]
MHAIRFAAIALTLCGLGTLTVEAQRGRKKPAAAARPGPAARPRPASRLERPVPFKVGETLTYDVAWSSFITAGTVVIAVRDKKPSFDSTAYYIVAEGRPTPVVGKLYTLYYKLDTLLDSYTLLPQRGSVYSEEGGKHVFKVSRFDQVAHRVAFAYESTNRASDDFPMPPYTQDVLSAIYVLRAVPLKAGDVITMPVTDDGINYKVRITVGAAERVSTPLREMSAWKLKLSIVDPAGQPKGRNVAMWLSNDAARLPIKFQAELPIGTFNLNLREVR